MVQPEAEAEVKTLDVAEEISDTTRLEVMRVVSSTGYTIISYHGTIRSEERRVISSEGGSLDDVPQKEILAVLQEIAGAKGLQLQFARKARDEAEKEGGVELKVSVEELENDDEPFPEKEKRELLPKQAEVVLQTLKERFEAEENKDLCPGLDWEKVKRSLEANPQALWSTNEMEKAGHVPTIYQADDTGFDIGTLSKETPESGKNCVYDEEAVKWARENHPDVKFNGSAEGQAQAMGIDLMAIEQYRHIAKNTPSSYEHSWNWFKTDPNNARKTGVALGGVRSRSALRVKQANAYRHHASRGWRGSLRVKWAV